MQVVKQKNSECIRTIFIYDLKNAIRIAFEIKIFLFVCVQYILKYVYLEMNDLLRYVKMYMVI